MLPELCRYIVLNPVRLKAVKNVARYRWSSYRATAGEVKAPSWLSSEASLAEFGRNLTVAQRKYVEFVEAGVNLPSPLSKVKAQVLLGSAAFIKKMKQQLVSKTNLKRAKSVPMRPNLKSLFPLKVREDKSLRNVAIKLAYKQYAYTMAAIAEAAQIHFSTVSKVIQTGEHKAA